jgi:hypothetical protein
MPLCQECRHALEGPLGGLMCHHPRLGRPARTNRLTGEEEASRGIPCDGARSALFECGPAGRLWEPAETEAERLLRGLAELRRL